MLRVAEYLRLSRKDGDKAESDSIGNQRDMLDAYIERHKEFELYDRYIDDDYTGTNFNRPGFIRMMNDIEDGNIDVVLVKDLSRFGRDYVDTGRYLQKVFPRLGIRFIAINDHIDSGKQAYDMLMPIKNIFNEQYARDISGKILSSVKSRQEAGKFVGAFACYGYFKDPNDNTKLVVDPYAASVVRRVFDLFISGVGKMSIARALNAEKVLCPSEYKKSLGMNYTNGNKIGKTNYWTYSTIQSILTNEMYAGTMVQNKASQSRYNARGGRMVNAKNEWIKVHGTHEPIISRETWSVSQDLLKRRTRQLNFQENVSVYAGFLKCADCGRAMSKVISNGRERYLCGTYKRYGKEYCSSHRIFADDLNAIVLSSLNEKISKIQNLLGVVEEAEREAELKMSSEKEPIQMQVDKLKLRLAKISKAKRELYEDYKSKLLTKEEFVEYKAEYQSQEEQLEKQIETLESPSPQTQILQKYPLIKKFKDTKQLSEINRTVLESMIQEIIIHENNKIQIVYKFDLDSIND